MQQTPTKQNKAYECAFLSYHSWTSWKQSVAPRLINDLKDVCTLPISTWSIFSLYIRPSLPNQVRLTFLQTLIVPRKAPKNTNPRSAALYCLWQQLMVIFLSTARSLMSSFMPLPPNPARCSSCLERACVKSPPLGEEPRHWKEKPSKVQSV